MSADDEDLPDAVIVAREQDRALDLFVQGKDYRYIAAELGRSVATAHKRVKDALHEARRLRAAEYVDVELAMMQDLQDRLYQQLALGGSPVRIAPQLLALSKERRRLLGLDAPKRVKIEDERPPAPSPELAAIVELAEKQAAVDEEELRGGR